MNEPVQRGDKRPGASLGSILARSAKIAVLVLVTILAFIAFTIWLGGDTSTLPFDYDGFD